MRGMDKYEMRRRRLQQLINDSYGGTAANFARAIERDPSYVSRMLYPAGKAGKKRIADDMIEHMEKKCGLPRGWFDNVSDAAGKKADIIPIRSADEITIKQFATGGAMGAGLELRDQPGVIQSWSVSPEWLHKNVKTYTAARNLCIVTGFGDSMRPMFNPGDPLIVDTGIHLVEYDAVYFFRVGNEGFIKRLQRIPTASGMIIRAKSENLKYDAWDITADMDLEVFGRVLKVWRSEDF